jgi:hypothetical protein
MCGPCVAGAGGIGIAGIIAIVFLVAEAIALIEQAVEWWIVHVWQAWLYWDLLYTTYAILIAIALTVVVSIIIVSCKLYRRPAVNAGVHMAFHGLLAGLMGLLVGVFWTIGLPIRIVRSVYRRMHARHSRVIYRQVTVAPESSALQGQQVRVVSDRQVQAALPSGRVPEDGLAVQLGLGKLVHLFAEMEDALDRGLDPAGRR